MNREQMSIGISSTREYLDAIVAFTKSPTKKMLEMLKIEQEKRAIRQTSQSQND